LLKKLKIKISYNLHLTQQVKFYIIKVKNEVNCHIFINHIIGVD